MKIQRPEIVTRFEEEKRSDKDQIIKDYNISEF